MLKVQLYKGVSSTNVLNQHVGGSGRILPLIQKDFFLIGTALFRLNHCCANLMQVIMNFLLVMPFLSLYFC